MLLISATLAGAEFEVVEAALEAEMSEQYGAAAGMWNQLRREFLYAAEQAEGAEREAGLPKRRGSLLWRSFWASHQRFFRHMCMAAKVERGSCILAHNVCTMYGQPAVEVLLGLTPALLQTHVHGCQGTNGQLHSA